MVCEKCGSEIKDGVKFCTKCGAKLVINKKQNVGTKNTQSAVGYNEDLADHVLHNESGRIESVEDPEVNKRLFSLYEKLIKPMEELESVNAQYNNNVNRINSLQPKIEAPIRDRIHSSWSIYWKFFIADFIIMFIIENILSALNAGNFIQNLLFYQVFILPEIIAVYFGFYKDTQDAKEANVARQSELEDLNREQAKLKEEIDKRVQKIQNAVRFVPEKYRSSYALKYFVDAYNNSQVDNLKEAVNAYESYAYRDESIKLQQEIKWIQDMQTELLKSIVFSDDDDLLTEMDWEELSKDYWWSIFY